MKKILWLVWILALIVAQFEGHAQTTGSGVSPLVYPYVVPRAKIKASKNVEAFKNYFIRVQETTGDTSVFYVDYRGASQKVSGTGGGSGSPADKDWLKIRNNGTPYSITDTIYTKKYAAVGQRYFWPGAKFAVMDSSARAALIVSGDRSATVGLNCYNTGVRASIEQNGSETSVTMQPGGEFSIVTAATGTLVQPTGPFVPHFIVTTADSTIRFPLYPNSRISVADPANFLFTDNDGVLSSKPLTALDFKVPVNVNPPLAGSGLALDPLYLSTSGGVEGDVMTVSGGLPVWQAPSKNLECVDTFALAAPIVKVEIGTPVVRTAAGNWQNITQFAQSVVPTGVVVWVNATVDSAAIAYCGAFQTAISPGGYYADSTGATTKGFTKVVPNGYQRPVFMVDSSGLLTPTLNLAFAPTPETSVISAYPVAGTGTAGNPLTISTAGAGIGDLLYFDGTDWNLGQGFDIQSLSFVNPNLTISGANTIDMSSVNYWSRSAPNLAYTAGAVSVGVSSSAAKMVIRGAGATSATKTLQLENSAGTQVLNAWDDSAVSIGAGSPSAAAKFQVILDAATKNFFRVSSPSGNLFSIRADGPFTIGDDNAGFGSKSSEFVYNTIAQYLVFSASNTAATSDQGANGQFWFIGRGGTGTTGATRLMSVGTGSATFAPTSGTKTFTSLTINPVINQTGTASGAIAAIEYLPTLTSVTGENRFIVSNANTAKSGFGTTTPTATMDLSGSTGYNQLRLRTQYTPTSTADTNGNTGDISIDDNFIYIKTTAGWKRSALTIF